jgi:hypothetical protein
MSRERRHSEDEGRRFRLSSTGKNRTDFLLIGGAVFETETPQPQPGTTDPGPSPEPETPEPGDDNGDSEEESESGE